MQAAESFAAFARRLNVARSTVTRAAQAGRLVMDDAGRVLVEPSLTAWHASRGRRDDVAERHAQARGRAIPAATAAPAPAAPPEGQRESEEGQDDEGTAEPSRAAFQALALAWQNKTMLIELDRVRGKRLEREALLREATGLGAALRSAVERLIDQTAPRLAVAASAEERARLLRNELAQVRRALKAEYPRALRRLASQAAQGAAPTIATPPESQP